MNKKYIGSIMAAGIASLTFAQAQTPIDYNPISAFDGDLLPFSIGVSVNGGYSTNPATTTEDDGSASVSAGISLGRGFGSEITRVSLGLSAGVSHFFNDYAGKDEDLEFSGGASLSLSRRLSERLTFNDSVSVSYGREPAFAPLTSAAGQRDSGAVSTDYNYPAGSVSRRIGDYFYGSNTAGINLELSPRLSSNTAYTISGLLYDNSGVSEREDRISHSASETLSWKYSEITSVNLGYHFSFHDYDTADRNTMTHGVTMGITRNPNDYLTTSFRVGAQLADSDASGDTIVRPSGSLVINYRLSPRTNFSWINSLAFDPSELGDYAYRYSYRSGISARYQATERLNLRAGASLSYSQYEDVVVDAPSSLTDDEIGFTANAGLSYTLFSNMNLNVGYSFSTYISDDGDREYDRHSVGAGISYAIN